MFFTNGAITIIHDDILTTKSITPNSVDLIVTSPPYNLGIPYNAHQDDSPYEQYLQFTKAWLAKCFQLLKDDGRACINVPLDTNKMGHYSIGADITTLAKLVGFQYRTTIVWHEGNISRRTAWGSWMSAASPCVIAPVEIILVLYKKHWHKTSGSGQSDITRSEFIEWTNGVWTFPGASKAIGHPAPFPLELPKRCVKLFSFVGDTVLDPFAGSGTTLIAAAMLNRIGIGVEIDRNYCELAKRRILSTHELIQRPLPL